MAVRFSASRSNCWTAWTLPERPHITTSSSANVKMRVPPAFPFPVETDLISNVASGAAQEVTLGYFAKACDVTSATDCQQAAERSSRKHALKTCGLHRSPRN